jgi:hypothetical protein
VEGKVGQGGRLFVDLVPAARDDFRSFRYNENIFTAAAASKQTFTLQSNIINPIP